MNEQMLGALKGLMHYLNGAENKPATRGTEIKTRGDHRHAGMQFEVEVRSNTQGLLGRITPKGDEYVFVAEASS